MIRRLKKFFLWLLTSTAITPPAPPPTPTEVEVDPHDTLTMGVFYFREQILDRLDEYAYYLRRMKKVDPEAYGLYSQVGATIMAKDAGFSALATLSPWWKQNRPAFGAVAMALHLTDHEPSDGTYPRFVYFQKLRPWFVEPFNGDVYEVTLYYDKRDAKHPGYFSYHVGLSPGDEKIRVLKSIQLEEHVIKRRGSPVKNYFTKKAWRLPDFSFFSHKVTGDHLFAVVASAYENSLAGAIRVACSKAGLEAVFNVDMKRTAYFFKDRSSGRDKRIFHVVRPHERSYQSGKTADIKMHFRGLRTFEWNDYQVHITVPGKHHSHMMDFEAEATALKPGERRPKGFVTMRKMGLQMQRVLHS